MKTFEAKITKVEHYTETLFMIRTERPASFRFKAGEFTMIGLPGVSNQAGRPILRAYSIASPTWDEELEFYSIKVQDGPLTQHLQKVRVGDTLLVGEKPTGTLITDALLPGRKLWLLATGTGAAPFYSLIREPEVYEKFDKIYLIHSCREVPELRRSEMLLEDIFTEPMFEDLLELDKLTMMPSATRTPGAGVAYLTDRITTMIENGKLLNRDSFDPKIDRVMICGSQGFLSDTKKICEKTLTEGSVARPGHFVIEKAFIS